MAGGRTAATGSATPLPLPSCPHPPPHTSKSVLRIRSISIRLRIRVGISWLRIRILGSWSFLQWSSRCQQEIFSWCCFLLFLVTHFTSIFENNKRILRTVETKIFHYILLVDGSVADSGFGAFFISGFTIKDRKKIQIQVPGSVCFWASRIRIRIR